VDSSRHARHHIAVVGPSDVTADDAVYALAADVGREVARRGGVVVCGGLGGVMEAAALGAQEAGGATLGILPSRQRTDGNRHLTMVMASGLGELRNGLILHTSDAVVAVGGSWGTLSEVALAMRLGLPVVVLRGWSVLDDRGSPVPGPELARTAEEAVAAALRRISPSGSS
jgi:uncharacterized protein (TIGR00725 family)